VFGLAHVLGITLMSRIRNCKDLTFFRLSEYVTVGMQTLCSPTVDRELIETHWHDLLQVVLRPKLAFCRRRALEEAGVQPTQSPLSGLR